MKLHAVIISNEMKLARRRGPVIPSAGFRLRLESLGGQGCLIRLIPLASLALRPAAPELKEHYPGPRGLT